MRQIWDLYVKLRAQQDKPALRVNVILVGTYPNKDKNPMYNPTGYISPPSRDFLYGAMQNSLENISCSAPFDRGELTIDASFTWLAKGGGRGCSWADLTPSLRSKGKSVLFVVNQDSNALNPNMCGQLCLTAAEHYNTIPSGFRKFIRYPSNLQKWQEWASTIGKELGVRGSMEFQDFQKYADLKASASGTHLFLLCFKSCPHPFFSNQSG